MSSTFTTSPASKEVTSNSTADARKALLSDGTIFDLAEYIASNPEKDPEVEAQYAKLRAEELDGMRRNPSRYGKQHIERLLSDGVFTLDELFAAEVITPKSWQKVQLNREYLPVMSDFQKGNQELTPMPGTDVYFFGMPSSGKTSLLMGMAAANGLDFTLDMRTNGGPYAAALRQYAQAGLTPGRTLGRFVTAISGEINDLKRNGKVKNVPINLIEMSGEEFALRIAETKEPSIANMGTGVTNMLRNDNQKIFFIIVDASKPMVKVSYLDHEISEDMDVAKQVKFRYISQLDILDKFMVLISLPENQEIMSRVSAIHFIVTKADSIESDTDEDRDTKALNLINGHYLSVVEQLKNYCRRTKRINKKTDFTPVVYTYSLGEFHPGDVFDYDNTDALKIIDAIRTSNVGPLRSSWQRFKDTFRVV